MKKYIVTLIACFILATACAVDKIGLVQSELVTMTVECLKINKINPDVCKEDPQIKEKIQELQKL